MLQNRRKTDLMETPPEHDLVEVLSEHPEYAEVVARILPPAGRVEVAGQAKRRRRCGMLRVLTAGQSATLQAEVVFAGGVAAVALFVAAVLSGLPVDHRG